VAKAKLTELFDDTQERSASGAAVAEAADDEPDGSSYTGLSGNVTYKMIESQARKLSLEFNIMCYIAALSPSLIVSGILWSTLPQYGHGCYGCNLDLIEYVCNNIGAFVLAPLALYFFVQMRDQADPLGFWNELKLTLIFVCIFSGPAVTLLTFDGWIGITATGKFNWEWIDFLGVSFFHFFGLLLFTFLQLYKFVNFPTRYTTNTTQNNTQPSRTKSY